MSDLSLYGRPSQSSGLTAQQKFQSFSHAVPRHHVHQQDPTGALSVTPPCLDETPCASARPYVCPVCHPFTKSQDTMRISKTAYLGVLPFLHASEPSPNLQFLLRFNPEKAANMQGESICEALTVIRSPNHGVGVLICVVQNSRNTQVSDFDVVVSSQKNIHRLHVAMQNLQDQCSACQEQAHAHTHARTPSHKCTRTTKQC